MGKFNEYDESHEQYDDAHDGDDGHHDESWNVYESYDDDEPPNVNTMTHPQNMNAMMMAMDPKMMFGMFGQQHAKNIKKAKYLINLPIATIPGFTNADLSQAGLKTKFHLALTREAKKNAFQTAMAVSPLINARHDGHHGRQNSGIAEDVSWDAAVEAMEASCQ